jgi:hypothetical protein
MVFKPRQHFFHLHITTKEQRGFVLLKWPETRVG